jgi:triosephosphate isomerase
MITPLVVGNWKMNTSLADAIVLSESIKNQIAGIDGIEAVLCPPFVWLYPIKEVLATAPKHLKLGAQNMYFVDSGAYTGEISPLMLKSLVNFVVLGHSERRGYFGESDDLVNDKIMAALEHQISPIVCIGELKKMADSPKSRGRPTRIESNSDIIGHLRRSLRGLTRNSIEKVIIAYEPVWAIGTGNPATGGYAAFVVDKIRDWLSDSYTPEIASRVRVLYGGSVTAENIEQFAYQPTIDGVLAGGASLKAKEFIVICEKFSQAKARKS